MRVVGIIAEFNPFHNGHKYLVDRVKHELEPEAIIAVMSGNFVQRGQPAMWNKWVRAKCAVENGIDLVFELPVCFAVNSGEEFARGAIRILKGLQVVTDLAFGSETGDKDGLEKMALHLSSEDDLFATHIKKALKTGLSYPAAYEKAFHLRFGKELLSGTILKGANDILALEYLKQNNIQDAKFNAFPVKRKGMGHDCGHLVTTYASASVIRKEIKKTKSFFISKEGVTARTFETCKNEHFLSEEDENRYFTLVRSSLLLGKKEEIASLLSVSEGLENNFKQALIHAGSLEELISHVKSKRHTYAKISRILVHSILGINKTLYERMKYSDLAYGRVLAFNKKGASTLRLLQDGLSQIPIYTNLNKNVPENTPEMSMLSLDCKASDMYSLITGASLYKGSDFVNRPYISCH